MSHASDYRQISEDLCGSDGVIYLLFVGRERYVAQIQEALLSSKKFSPEKRGFFKNKENVNQAFERLKEKGEFYLRFVKREAGRGNPNVYTVNLEPLFATLEGAKVEFQRSILDSLLTSLSPLSDDFPSYLIKASTLEGRFSFTHEGLVWPRTLGLYFLFLATSLSNMSSMSLKSRNKTFRDTPMFHVLSAVFPSSIRELHRKRIQEILETTPDIAFHFFNIALALILLDTSARQTIPSYIFPDTQAAKTLECEGTTAFCPAFIDTYLQFNRLVMWIFIPNHLTRPHIQPRIQVYLEKMLAAKSDLDNQERAHLISDIWGSIATFWWCKELQSNGECDLSQKTCPVWPRPKEIPFKPEISPLQCQYVQESIKEYLEGKRHFDYGQRMDEGKSTSLLDFIGRGTS